MQVPGARGRRIAQDHACLAQPPAEVEVLVVIGEVLVETADSVEELALERDVAGVEPAEPRVVAVDAVEVELARRPVEPSQDGTRCDVGMPVDPAEDGDPPVGLGGVPTQVVLDELRLRHHVVAEEEHERRVAGADAGVARGARAAVLLHHDPNAVERRDVLVGPVRHDDGEVGRAQVTHRGQPAAAPAARSTPAPAPAPRPRGSRRGCRG